MPMPSALVTAWADQLKSINSTRPKELTKSRINEIAKAALRAKSEYKHVVHAFEKFVPRCKFEHKLSIIYVLDSLLRTSRNILKAKDPFAKRFYTIFEKIFPAIIECPPKDQMAIVRTINLWIANGIYTEEEFAPFKTAWAKEGIETDVAEVERIVKGDKANMALYKHKENKEKRRSHETKVVHEAMTPPGPPPPSSFLPDEQRLTLSTEVPEGGISEARFVELLQKFDCDFGGTFSTDRARLDRAFASICEKLANVEAERRAAHAQSIKKLLKFDYSDDEDEGEEGKKKEEEEDPYVPMGLEEREALVGALLTDEKVRDALNLIYKEKMEKLAQLAREAKQKNMAAAGLLMPAQPVHPTMPPTTGIGMSAPPMPNFQGIPGLPGLPQGLNPALLQTLPGGFSGALPGMQNLQNLQNSAQPNLPPQSLMNLGGLQLPAHFAQLPPPAPQQGLLPGMNMLPGGIDFQQLLASGPIGVPPPQLNAQLGNLPSTSMSNIPGIQGAMGFPPQFGNIPPNTFPMMQRPTTPIEEEMMRNQSASEDRGRRKRSRSRDRDHKKNRRSRSRERKDRSSTVEEDQKKKRKSGFPVLPTTYPESLFVVSRTLWFGRLASTVTDKDIHEAIRSYGKATAVTVIPPKACAFVTMENRKAANDVLKAKRDRGSIKIKDKEIKMKYSLPPKILNEEDKATWDQEKGYLLVSWKRLPPLAIMATYFEGAQLDVDTLPAHLSGLIDEFARPVQQPPQQTLEQTILSTEGDMEMSSPISHDMPSMSNFNNMPSLMGLPPNLSGSNLPGINPLLLQQRGLPSMQGAPGLPPGLQGGLIGLHPSQTPLGLLQAQQFPQNIGVPLSGQMPPPMSFENINSRGEHAFDNNRGEMRGGFRGGRGGRGGFRGDRGGFHGDRGGFRNNWNDRPPRDDFRGGDRRDRGDFRRDDRGGDFRRGGGRRDWDNGRDHNRDFGRDRSPPPQRDQAPRSEERRDRRDGGDRREGGRRRESRWGSVDDRVPLETHNFVAHGTEPIPPGVEHNGEAKHFPPLRGLHLPDESMVTSTTAEPESAPSQEEAQQ